MFRLFFRRKKSSQENVANEGKPSPPQQSVPDPAAAATQLPAPPPKAEEPKKTKKKKKWTTRLFRFFQKKDCESAAESETTAPKATKKRSWWPFKFRKRTSRVSPAPMCEVSDQTEPKSDETNSGLNASCPADTQTQTDADPLLAVHDLKSTLMDYIQDIMRSNNTKCNVTQLVNTLCENMKEDLYEHLLELIGKQLEWDDMDASEKVETSKCAKVTDSKVQTANRFGFPNIGNSCYMNSCLQSLLSLEDFIREISCQEHLWESVPEAQLLRQLINMRDCRESKNSADKINHLCSFKNAFATHAPQYKDNLQKDAHEFLTLLMEQIRTMSPVLQETAALMGQSYTCPVENHLTFKMESMRTCKSCGAQRSQQEDFTSLSLDLVEEGSVSDMLAAHLKDKELEFKCECGGTTSGLKSSFDTLPRVLILHLKRFSLSPTYELEKLHDPIELERDLMISSNQGAASYSLVSVISHQGNIKRGHYISNSIHPDDSPNDPADRWLKFDDKQVVETTGSTVCDGQKNLAYILFYIRQV